MIKSNRLKKGDKVAIVSLSWGGLEDKELIHKYFIAKERIEKELGYSDTTVNHFMVYNY